MIYKFIGRMHLWDWQDLKEEIKGDIISYETAGNIIKSITYNSDLPEDAIIKMANRYGLRVYMKKNTKTEK